MVRENSRRQNDKPEYICPFPSRACRGRSPRERRRRPEGQARSHRTLARGATTARKDEDMDIEAKVKSIIAQHFQEDASKIAREMKFIEDLGADSLQVVELVLSFEENFEIDIPDEDTEKIRTVGDAIDYISAHAKK
jgi:acyl carrier protein